MVDYYTYPDTKKKLPYPVADSRPEERLWCMKHSYFEPVGGAAWKDEAWREAWKDEEEEEASE